MINYKYTWVFLFIIFLVICNSVFAGQYILVSPDLEIYYEEQGVGSPMIFVPGWTMTTEFFVQHQIPYFARKYRVITYDPRSHGRSTKTMENNNYTQHGKDLRALIDVLKLKEVILVGWSWGCYDVYAYFREFGTDNVKAFICIDQPPRSIPAQKGDWAEFSSAAEVGEIINATVYNRRRILSTFIPTMVKGNMAQNEIDWIMDQMLKTPTFAAALLVADGSFADYTEEARMINGNIPVMNIVSEKNAESAKVWLSKNAPESEIHVLGNHMMFREFPNEFNEAVDKFLSRIK